MHPAVYQYQHLSDNGLITTDPWQEATQKAKHIASQRRVIVVHLEQLCRTLKLAAAIKTYLQQIAGGGASLALVTAHESTKSPKASTLRGWYLAYLNGGLKELLPKYSGTSRINQGWEARAIELFHKTSKPSLSKVTRDLKRKYGFRNVAEHNVRYFFSRLPADLQENSPWRMGRKQYTDALRQHVKRTTENLPVGALYQGDGHQIDVYLRHPNNGSLWRPELVVFMDIKTRYIVSWFICEQEASLSTLACLSNALGTYNHVPALLHIDNGSGFKSKMMNSDTAGFYKNLGMEVIFAIPGNAKAKNIERWFRTMEDDFGKDWDTYCGYDQSPDVSRHFSKDKLTKLAKEGKIHWPTLEEWQEGFVNWLEEDYHNRPHPEYPDTTPAAMWAELENTPVEDFSLLVKPRKDVTVHRSNIRMDNRLYTCDFLHQLEGQKLIAEYDINDDSTIRLFNEDGVWLTTALLKSRRDYITPSRVEDAKRKSLAASRKRLANKDRELQQRAGITVSQHTEQVEQMDAMQDSIDELEALQQPTNDSDFDFISEHLLQQPELEPEPDVNGIDMFELLDAVND